MGLVAYGKSRAVGGRLVQLGELVNTTLQLGNEDRTLRQEVVCFVHLIGSVSYLHAYITRTSDIRLLDY